MARRRPGPPGMDDFFSGFDDLFRRVFEDLEGFEFPGGAGKEPVVYGVNVRISPEGRPVVSQFGNVEKGRVRGEREPLVDVIEEKDVLRIVVELPGVEKEEIRLDASPQQLRVEVADPRHRFSKAVGLPVRVDEKSAKATYKNGILEVVFKRAEPAGEKPGGKIKVE